MPRGRAVAALWALYVVVFAVWVTSGVALMTSKRLTGFTPQGLFNATTGLLVLTSLWVAMGFTKIQARQHVMRRAE